ncbi:forkhead box protein L2-like protein, partial [Leptotrombidium deliense]
TTTKIATKAPSTSDPAAKPALSYVALIFLALKDSPGKKLPLCDIYKWITKNYPYYRPEAKGWQNSIRHNLSLNDCFQKIPREIGKNRERKGNDWKLVPEFEDMFEKGSYKRRKNTRKSK